MNLVFSTNENKKISNTDTKKTTQTTQTTQTTSISSIAFNNRYLQMNMVDRLQNSKKCKSCGGK